MGLHRNDPTENNSPSPSTDLVGSPLKLKPHKVELKTEKIFELYLDSEPIRKRDRSNQVTPERVDSQANINNSQANINSSQASINSSQANINQPS